MAKRDMNNSQDHPLQLTVMLENISKGRFPENILELVFSEQLDREMLPLQTNHTKNITDLFDRFITGPAEEGRETAELSEKYETFYEVVKQAHIHSEQSRKIEDSLFGVAIEAETQGFIYGFKVFELLINKWIAFVMGSHRV